MTTREEIESTLLGMEQKLAIMEWDVQRGQINPAKRVKYDQLKTECHKLKQELQNAQ